MTFKPLKYYLFSLCSAWGCFFGAGLVDRHRLEAEKPPFFAAGPIAIPQEDYFVGLIYQATVFYEVADWPGADWLHLNNSLPRTVRLPAHQEGGHLNFRWNYWTLLAVTLFALVFPHMFERIPKKKGDDSP